MRNAVAHAGDDFGTLPDGSVALSEA
eukprot:SAG31_NODE_39429_length_288_cov_0.820106_2_plen_25_part_01